MSDLEDQFALQLRAAGLPEPLREYQFHGTRKWRCDMAWPEYRVLAEIQGGTYQHMGHSTGEGLHRDYEKINSAQMMGYVALQFDRRMIEDGSALAAVCDALKWRCEG